MDKETGDLVAGRIADATRKRVAKSMMIMTPGGQSRKQCRVVGICRRGKSRRGDWGSAGDKMKGAVIYRRKMKVGAGNLAAVRMTDESVGLTSGRTNEASGDLEAARTKDKETGEIAAQKEDTKRTDDQDGRNGAPETTRTKVGMSRAQRFA